MGAGSSSWKVAVHGQSASSPRRKAGKTGSNDICTPGHYGPLYTQDEAASYLGVCARTIARWVKSKRLNRIKRVGRNLYPQSELDRFVAANM